MPDSFVHLCIHIIFSTKERQRYIKEDIERRLFPYLSTLIANNGGKSISINGTEDHVHLLCLAPKTISHSEFVKLIKSSSSKWIHETFQIPFKWQVGYASFSVSKSQIPLVKSYISRQKEHHRRMSFQEEFQQLLKLNGFLSDD